MEAQDREKFYLAIIAVLTFVTVFRFKKTCPKCPESEKETSKTIIQTFPIATPQTTVTPVVVNPQPVITLEDVPVYTGPPKFMTVIRGIKGEFYKEGNKYFKIMYDSGGPTTTQITVSEMIEAYNNISNLG